MSEISYIFQYHYDKDIDVTQVHENIYAVHGQTL